MMLSPFVMWKPLPPEAHGEYRLLLVCTPISPIVAVTAYLYYIQQPAQATACLIALALTTAIALLMLRKKAGGLPNAGWRYAAKAAIAGLAWAVVVIAAHSIHPQW